MAITEFFAGVAVADFKAMLAWYERLFGQAPDFFPHESEAVWRVTDHAWVYVVADAERAGGALLTILVDDLDAVVAAMGDRGLEPTKRETYSNGVRKITYHDPDGNEIGFGGVPLPD
jgi:catechol 2,3-dioxygenase-like lactoylglutathione lyase family enzyme